MDYKLGIDLAVLLFTAYSTYNNMKMRMEVARLKLWIIQNFQARDRANFLDDVGD